MGMLIANSFTTVTLSFRENMTREVQVQVVSALFPPDDSLKDIGMLLSNFNNAWAFITDQNIDKQLLQFHRDMNGTPVADFVVTKTTGPRGISKILISVRDSPIKDITP